MQAKRINLILPVRQALIDAGISTVRVVNAVNAELGALEATGGTLKLGSGTVTKKAYRVTETVSTKFEGRKTVPLVFDAWHSKLEAAFKVARFETVGLPVVCKEWLEKMKATPEEQEKEKEKEEVA